MAVTYHTTSDIPLGRLTKFPGNPRRGNIPEIQASIRRHGQYRSLVVRRSDDTLVILAGNHTFEAIRAEGHETARCEIVTCTDDEARRINLADNKLAELGDYNTDELVELLSYLDQDYEGTGWTAEDVSYLIDPTGSDTPGPAVHTDPDAVPEPPAEPVTKPGDLWLLGPHRLLCGDSTNPADVQRVADTATVTMIHADPPYGMGKESDGVLNDNLYGPKLDAFQMSWWRAWLPVLADNGSAYIWGNAPDLWRLWWAGGLSANPDLMVRNEIVWNKGSAPGMASAGEHSYVTATERCLFLMRGRQFLGNQNKDDFWEGYEPLRVWLCAQRDLIGWTNRDVDALTGTQMAGHWFTQSQFIPISAKHYATLRDAAAGRAFVKGYDELFAEMFPDLHGDPNAYRRDLAAQLRADRTYFDNTHDTMTDVWAFGRVVGEDRHGHATPNPVAMVERAIKSSSQPGDTIAAPFAGTGPEYIAGHKLDRVVVGMELEPAYCDVIARRYQEHTGTIPQRLLPDGTTEPHNFAN